MDKTGRDDVGLETGNCGNVTVSSPPDEDPFVEYNTTDNFITKHSIVRQKLQSRTPLSLSLGNGRLRSYVY